MTSGWAIILSDKVPAGSTIAESHVNRANELRKYDASITGEQKLNIVKNNSNSDDAFCGRCPASPVDSPSEDSSSDSDCDARTNPESDRESDRESESSDSFRKVSADSKASTCASATGMV